MRIQTINVTKYTPSADPPVTINSCTYAKLKITITFILTVLLEIGRKGLDLKGYFVLDITLGLHLITCISGYKCIFGHEALSCLA